MTLLIAGLILFLGVHIVGLVAPQWRQNTMARTGKTAYMSAHGLIALIGLSLIVVGYGDARMTPDFLWVAPVWTRHLASLFTLMAFIVLPAAFIPGTWIKSKVGFPLLAAIKAWAFAHLLANGAVHDVLLFGSFLAWSVIGYIVYRKRDRKAGVRYEFKGISRDLIAVTVGVGLWALVAFWLHRALIGVAPFGV